MTVTPIEEEEVPRGLVNKWLARCRQRRLDREERRMKLVEHEVYFPPGSKMHGSDRSYVVMEDGSWRRIRKTEGPDGRL